jgi:hypothetical protein
MRLWLRETRHPLVCGTLQRKATLHASDERTHGSRSDTKSAGTLKLDAMEDGSPSPNSSLITQSSVAASEEQDSECST